MSDFKQPKFKIGQIVFRKDYFSSIKINEIESNITQSLSVSKYRTIDGCWISENNLFETREEALLFEVQSAIDKYQKEIEKEKKENKI